MMVGNMPPKGSKKQEKIGATEQATIEELKKEIQQLKIMILVLGAILLLKDLK
jgi:hypothetical protein